VLEGSTFRLDLGFGLEFGRVEEAEKGVRGFDERMALRAIIEEHFTGAVLQAGI